MVEPSPFVPVGNPSANEIDVLLTSMTMHRSMDSTRLNRSTVFIFVMTQSLL